MSQPKLGNKAARDFARKAEAYGFELVRSKKHLVFRHRESGVNLVISGSRHSDGRALANNLKRMQRLSQQAAA